MEEGSKLQWLIQFLHQQPKKRAPNAKIVGNSEGRWTSVHDFISWRETYLDENKLKAYQTRGGGTALPFAETLSPEERIQEVMKFLKGKSPNPRATNREIIEHMELNAEDWDELKHQMKQKNLLASYRTRGGGVLLISPEVSKRIQREVISLRDITDEKVFCQHVEKDWAKGVKSAEFNHVFNIFAQLKGKGKWDNPDIFAVRLRSMNYVRDRPCIIVGIETKLGISREAILQTYSYLRFCHYAYLVTNRTEDEILSTEEGLLAEYATDLGIGVVGVAERGEEVASPFVEVIQPRAHIPSLYEVDRFLKSHAEKFKSIQLELDNRYFGASLS